MAPLAVVVTRTEEDEKEEGEEEEWRRVDFNVRWNSGFKGVKPPPTREGGREGGEGGEGSERVVVGSREI